MGDFNRNQDSEPARDLKLLRHLLGEPEKTRAELAGKTKIPDSTIQRRLAAWQESGDLIHQFTLGPENCLYPTRAMIGVKLNTENIKSDNYHYQNQREFVCLIKWHLAEFPEFQEIANGVVLERVEQMFGGPYEVVILVAALNPNSLAAFVTGVIQKLDGVINTTTSLLVSYSKSVWKPKGQTPKSKTKGTA